MVFLFITPCSLINGLPLAKRYASSTFWPNYRPHTATPPKNSTWTPLPVYTTNLINTSEFTYSTSPLNCVDSTMIIPPEYLTRKVDNQNWARISLRFLGNKISYRISLAAFEAKEYNEIFSSRQLRQDVKTFRRFENEFRPHLQGVLVVIPNQQHTLQMGSPRNVH